MKIKRRSSLHWLCCLVLINACASTRGAQDVAPSDTPDVEWLRSQIDWRSSVRVSVEGKMFELTRPRATAEGLEYGEARGVGASGEAKEGLPHPVPLSEIDRIEVRESSGSFEYLLAGAALGLAAGAVISLPYASDPDSSAEPYGAMAFFGTIGGAGLVVGATKQEWKPIFVRAQSGER